MMLSELFKERIAELVSAEPRVAGLSEALTSTKPAVSVRFNRRKIIGMPATVAGEPVLKGVPWCEHAYYLSQRPMFTFDPLMHMGCYYVQDASSMFIAHVIKEITQGEERPLLYLDACAAPGGKTTAAIDALPEGSLVVANEWDYRRAEILRENLTKWGYINSIVSRGDTSRFKKLKSTFDIIAADVPCSGEGMMRKDPEAVAQWSTALVRECAARQREIVDNLWGALKDGGYFIYSTCTFNRAENEDIVRHLIENLGARAVDIPTDPSWGILPAIGLDTPCYRFMPHRVEGEGLFMAVLRKGEPSPTRHDTRHKEQRPTKNGVKLPAWVPDTLTVKTIGDTVWGLDRGWSQPAGHISSALDVIAAGIELGTVKGRDFIPSQGAAMWSGLDTTLIDTVEVDETTALDYLRRDTITMPHDAPRGHILLTFRHHPLGWVKNIGTRANNLYPTPWRILKSRPHL